MQHYFKVVLFLLLVVLLIQCSTSKNTIVNEQKSTAKLGLKSTRQRCTYKGTVEVKLYKTLNKNDSSFSIVPVEFEDNSNYAYFCERSEKGNLVACQVIDCNSKTKYLLTAINDSIQIYKRPD